MINETRLNELRSEVGEDDLAEVIVLFCEEVEEVLEGLSSVPLADLAEKLHFLKGSAFNLGFDGVGKLCEVGETKLKEEATDNLNIDAITTAYFDAKSEIQSILSPT